MTINYLIVWVRVRVKVLDSVNSNHYHNPRHIYNKSCGLDGVNAEHLKHCSDRILPMLAMCFTGLFIHGVLPPSMISVVLVPIVKNKRISICSKNNYRPIALPSFPFRYSTSLLGEPGSPSIVVLCGCAFVWTMSKICVKEVC